MANAYCLFVLSDVRKLVAVAPQQDPGGQAGEIGRIRVVGGPRKECIAWKKMRGGNVG